MCTISSSCAASPGSRVFSFKYTNHNFARGPLLSGPTVGDDLPREHFQQLNRQAGTHIPVAPADWSPGAAYRCNGVLEYKKIHHQLRFVPGPWHPRCFCPRGQTCRAPAGVARAPHCAGGNCCGFLGQGGGGEVPPDRLRPCGAGRGRGVGWRADAAGWRPPVRPRGGGSFRRRGPATEGPCSGRIGNRCGRAGRLVAARPLDPGWGEAEAHRHLPRPWPAAAADVCASPHHFICQNLGAVHGGAPSCAAPRHLPSVFPHRHRRCRRWRAPVARAASVRPPARPATSPLPTPLSSVPLSPPPPLFFRYSPSPPPAIHVVPHSCACPDRECIGFFCSSCCCWRCRPCSVVVPRGAAAVSARRRPPRPRAILARPPTAWWRGWPTGPAPCRGGAAGGLCCGTGWPLSTCGGGG